MQMILFSQLNLSTCWLRVDGLFSVSDEHVQHVRLGAIKLAAIVIELPKVGQGVWPRA